MHAAGSILSTSTPDAKAGGLPPTSNSSIQSGPRRRRRSSQRPSSPVPASGEQQMKSPRHQRQHAQNCSSWQPGNERRPSVATERAEQVVDRLEADRRRIYHPAASAFGASHAPSPAGAVFYQFAEKGLVSDLLLSAGPRPLSQRLAGPWQRLLRLLTKVASRLSSVVCRILCPHPAC